MKVLPITRSEAAPAAARAGRLAVRSRQQLRRGGLMGRHTLQRPPVSFDDGQAT